MTWQENPGLDSRTADDFPSFRSYLDTQEELFVESMQGAADNQWNLIADRMKGGAEQEICAEMDRWWDGQVRRFRIRLWKGHHRSRTLALKRRLRRENMRRVHAEEQMRAAEVELYQVEGDLAAERELTAYLQLQRRCRYCDGVLGD